MTMVTDFICSHRIITTYYNRADEWYPKHEGRRMELLEESNGTKMRKEGTDQF